MSETPGLIRHLVVLVESPSARAEAQLPWAVLLCRTFGIPLTLLHVSDPARVNEPMELALAMASDYLRLIASMLPGSLDAKVEVRAGLVQEEWRTLAQENPGAALMIQTHTQSPLASLAAGNVAEDLLGAIASPLVIVPSGSTAPPNLTRIAVGSDRTSVPESVLNLARQMAPGSEMELIEIEVLEPGSRPDFELLQVQAQMSPHVVKLRGHAGPSILAVARLHDAQLIVAGTNRKRGPLSSSMGGTARWLANNSDRPVVLVPAA